MNQGTSDIGVHRQRQGNADDPEYDDFLARLNTRFQDNISQGKRPLFTTDAGELFAAYLDTFPTDQRQYHTCNACRHFVERFGALVTIDESGMTAPAIWHEDDAPELYKPAVRAMAKLVRRAKVTGVHRSSLATWGQPVTGIWHHMSVTPPASMVHRTGGVLDAGQVMAEKREDFKNVAVALGEFKPEHVAQAVTLLKTDALYRSEKVLGAAEWLARLHAARAEAKGKDARDNVLWLAVALAPAGFCHPRSSMIGTLLEDIAAGKPYDDVARSFKAKMHPLQYQRPQAAPSAGNIAQAEEIVAKMGIATALRRRFARLEEVEAIWRPQPPAAAPKAGGVFADLLPKGAAPASSMAQPAITITWDKFRRTVLPDAREMELLVSHGPMNFTALVTAADPDAAPILQWDSPERRNPVSWYVWNGGSPARQWGLAPGWVRVSAITLKPSMWGGDESRYKHQGFGAVILLEGARETRFTDLALFPETLRSELHGVRATIEAHSRSRKIEGAEEASACGLAIHAGGGAWDCSLRVADRAGAKLVYKLDRWD